MTRSPKHDAGSRPAAACWLLLTALVLPACLAAGAQDALPPTVAEKLSIHGYLTQAYATTDDHTLFGIPEDGTSDYRTAALQFRWAASTRDTFVVQFTHFRAGEGTDVFSPEPIDLGLDWAFYERSLTRATSLKVGKVQIPLGIYNEIRDVGTLLPFFRPPVGFYTDLLFTSETVDGVVVSHRFRRESPWSIDLDAYYGGWQSFEPGVGQRVPVRIEHGLGTQLWLNTPVEGLRLGAGANRQDVRGGLLRPAGQTDEWTGFHVSIDGDFNRFVARAEYREIDFPILVIGLQGDGLNRAYHAQFGVRLGRKWRLFVQSETWEAELVARPVLDATLELYQDYAVAVHYVFQPNLVLKLETHSSDTQLITDVPVNFFSGEVPSVDYSLLSLSTSF